MGRRWGERRKAARSTAERDRVAFRRAKETMLAGF